MKIKAICLTLAPSVLTFLPGCSLDVADNVAGSVPVRTILAHEPSLSRIYFQSEKSIFCASEAMDVKECNITEEKCKTVLVVGGKINAIEMDKKNLDFAISVDKTQYGPSQIIKNHASGSTKWVTSLDEGRDRKAEDLTLAKNKKLLAVSVGERMSIQIRNTENGKQIDELHMKPDYIPSHATPLKFDGTENLLAAGYWKGHTYVWDLKQRKVIAELKSPYRGLLGADFSVKGLAFSDQNKYLVVGTADRDGGTAMMRWRLKDKKLVLTATEVAGVLAMQLSPDGQTLGVIEDAQDYRLLLVDARTLKVRKVLAQKTEPTFRCLDFSPDGRRLAVGTTEGTIEIYNLASEGG